MIDTAAEMKGSISTLDGLVRERRHTVPDLPSNEASKVFTTSIDGKLVHTLNPPMAIPTSQSDRQRLFQDRRQVYPNGHGIHRRHPLHGYRVF